LNKNEKAFIYASKSLIISSQNGDLTTLTESLLLNAYISTYNKELSYALKYYLQAANNTEKLGDSLKIAQIYNQIGLIYVEVEAYTKSTEYFKKSYNISPN